MSVFKKATVTFSVDMRFWAIGCLKQTAKSEITEKLMEHVQELDGTILAYENVRPVQKFARCYADTPACHIEMQADVLLFKPYKGAQLPATVTYVSSSCVSLEVLDAFQGYVDISELKEKWTFDGDAMAWRNNDTGETFGAYETVVVEVIDSSPTNANGVSLKVNIVRKSDVVPQIQADDEAMSYE